MAKGAAGRGATVLVPPLVRVNRRPAAARANPSPTAALKVALKAEAAEPMVRPSPVAPTRDGLEGVATTVMGGPGPVVAMVTGGANPAVVTAMARQEGLLAVMERPSVRPRELLVARETRIAPPREQAPPTAAAAGTVEMVVGGSLKSLKGRLPPRTAVRLPGQEKPGAAVAAVVVAGQSTARPARASPLEKPRPAAAANRQPRRNRRDVVDVMGAVGRCGPNGSPTSDRRGNRSSRRNTSISFRQHQFQSRAWLTTSRTTSGLRVKNSSTSYPCVSRKAD
jgi:hypothetical protein